MSAGAPRLSLAQWRARATAGEEAEAPRADEEWVGPAVACAGVPEACLALVRRLRQFRAASRVKVHRLLGSLSGAQVLVATPFGADGCELPKSVLKYDKQHVIHDEARLMEEHGKDWGPTCPQRPWLPTTGIVVSRCEVPGPWLTTTGIVVSCCEVPGPWLTTPRQVLW